MVSIIIAILVFSVIVIFHELGHFWLAKANGIRVNEFSLGLGPTIVGFTKGDTKYSIKLLPFGGACAMEGEDEESDDEKAFGKKSVWARMSVVFAGPFFNFIMAFVVAIILIGLIGYDAPVIGEVLPDSAAQEAGLMAGDEITNINGHNIYVFREITMEVYKAKGNATEITFMRDGEKHKVTANPKWNEEEGRYMFGLMSEGSTKANIGTALKYGVLEVRFLIYTTIESLKMLFTGGASFNDVSGPVGIVKQVGDSYSANASAGVLPAVCSVLSWIILLSGNLGVMNLLPLPALDGGRLVFLIIEAIRGKRVDPNKEAYVHFFGIILLLGFMVLVMFNDIRKLFL